LTAPRTPLCVVSAGHKFRAAVVANQHTLDGCSSCSTNYARTFVSHAPLKSFQNAAPNTSLTRLLGQRLSADQDIQKRVAEIQSLGAERAAITVETLIAEAEAARSKAMGEKGGANAAVAAITVKAKLAGLWLDKTALTDPSGENAPRYTISDRPMTEEEWERERCGE
jgi:hypothetical protein